MKKTMTPLEDKTNAVSSTKQIKPSRKSIPMELTIQDEKTPAVLRKLRDNFDARKDRKVKIQPLSSPKATSSPSQAAGEKQQMSGFGQISPIASAHSLHKPDAKLFSPPVHVKTNALFRTPPRPEVIRHDGVIPDDILITAPDSWFRQAAETLPTKRRKRTTKNVPPIDFSDLPDDFIENI
ncbi:uncharacterized protein [Oscarella lobularis]|uniref:uncharacterized protein n=1 Tax=Oscarella lobularis TaxID=121494 RepID=UPI003313E8FB